MFLLYEEPWLYLELQKSLACLQGHGLEPPSSHLAQAAQGASHPAVAPVAKNFVWALDFMHDTLCCGKPFRTLNVIEVANPQVPDIEIETSLPAARVLEQLGGVYGLPEALRLDDSQSCVNQHRPDGMSTNALSFGIYNQASPAITPLSSDYRLVDQVLFEDRPHTANGEFPLVQNCKQKKNSRNVPHRSDYKRKTSWD